MTKIKSLAVGNGDMFYIRHMSDNFSIIDSSLSDDNKKRIVDEIISESKGKGITRFISTHPDHDHIMGLEYLDDRIGIVNFYCVKNAVEKIEDTDSFKRYCALRDSDKAFYIYKDCERRWMNQSDDTRGSAGIEILWPLTSNQSFKDALSEGAKGNSPNNISPVIQYSTGDRLKVLWMGDLETDFMEAIKPDISLPKATIIFAPHHGRESGKIPQDWLDELQPKLIIIGEAPSQHLNYYQGYNTITQNSAGDITFECDGKRSKVHIYVSNRDYSVSFLQNERMGTYPNYIGTLNF